jgi:uncharacterized protein (DUF1015 family)
MALLEEPNPFGEEVVRGLSFEPFAIHRRVPQISPFTGLLFDRSRVGPLDRVTTPPYDTISAEEHNRYLDRSPHNIVRLDLGEGGEADDKYRRASMLLRAWREEGILVPTPGPLYYLYEMRFSLHGRRRRIGGLICAVELEDWGGSIVPHERTMRGPVEDRLRLIREVRANLSSIHAVLFGPCLPLSRLLERARAPEPAAQTVDEEGVEHRMWMTADDGGVGAWLQGSSLLIADGHHRYETALSFRDEMRRTHGSGPWDRTMMLVMDAETEDPPVLPYHRMARSGPPPIEGTRVRDLQEVLDEVDDEALVYGTATTEEGELVHRVATLSGEPPTVGALHRLVLDGREDDLLFTPDAVEAEEAVRTRRAAAAFFLPQTTAARIRASIERGERLPRKSTFFWPKPRTGMVIRPLEP